MPGNASGAAKAREARSRILEERRRREIAEQAVALGLVQPSGEQPPSLDAPPALPPEQPAASVPASVQPAPVAVAGVNAQVLAATQLQQGSVEAAVLLRRLVRGDVRATPNVRKDAAVSILAMNGFGRGREANGNDLQSLVAQAAARGQAPEEFYAQVARVAELARRKRDAVTIEQPPQGEPGNTPKT